MATIAKAKKAAEECSIEKQNNSIILGILDTYHDFCKSERLTKSAREKRARASSKSENENEEGEEEEEKEDEEEEKKSVGSRGSSKASEGDEPDPNRIQIMREYLPKLLFAKYGTEFKLKGTDPYQDNVEKITCKKVTSVSSIEHKAVKMFEEMDEFRDVLSASPECKEVETFENIIKAYTTSQVEKEKLLNKYKQGKHLNILEISQGSLRFGKGDNANEAKQIEYLSDFILQYFFANSIGEKNIHAEDVYMTFDAGERIVGDIFHDRPNVKCAIFPETLADSATTSLSMLNGRNVFVFPSTETERPFTSNIFTENDYTMKMVKSGFSEENPYGFTFVIESKTDTKKNLKFPFSAKQNQGPSVNYLIDILERAQENAKAKAENKKPYADIAKKGTILNLGEALDENSTFRLAFEEEVKAHTNGIIPDLKRAGDHEAVLASKEVQVLPASKYKLFVFCTIDILCALKSRLEQNNTIYQGKNKIILYRFPKVIELTPREKYDMVGKEIFDIVSKIHTFTQTNIVEKLRQQKPKFEEGKTAIVPYADIKKEPYYKQRCEEMLNALLRIAMLDLSEYCQKLIDENATFQTVTFENAKTGNLSLEEISKAFLPFYDSTKEDSMNRTYAVLLPKIVDDNGAIQIKNTTTNTVVTSNLETIRKKVIDHYQKVVATVKEQLELAIRSNTEIEIMKDSFLQRDFQIVKDVTESRPDLEKKNDLVFKLEEHAVFGFNPAVFEKFYDHMIFLHDFHQKNQAKASREYDKIFKKVLSDDPTAPFHFFQTVEELVDQFKTERYQTAIAKILDIRSFTEKEKITSEAKYEKLKSYLIGLDIFMKDKPSPPYTRQSNPDYYNSTKPENGLVINLANYYYELKGAGTTVFKEDLATIGYEPPSEKAAKAAKAAAAVKRGGGPGTSIYQYYDLNNLLYQISSTAASYIESAYCELYPAYQYYNTFLAIDKKEFKVYQSQLLSVIKDLKQLLADSTRISIARTFTPIDKEKINTVYQPTLNSILKNVTEATDKTSLETRYTELENQIFKVICKVDLSSKIVFPSIQEFLQKLSSVDYIDKNITLQIQYITSKKDKTAKDIETLRDLMQTENTAYAALDELDTVWQANTFEFRQNKNYIYNYETDSNGFSSEEFLNYLLTLRAYEQGSAEYVVPAILAGYNMTITDTASKKYDIYSYLGDNVFFFDPDPETEPRKLTKPVITKQLKGIKDLVNTIKQPGLQIEIPVAILFFFTLLENMMNVTGKHSFFLRDFYSISFQAEAEWKNKLYTVISDLLQYITITLSSTAAHITLDNKQYGGSKRYPKKTRKVRQAKHSRKSRKYNKTRRSFLRK